jgi:hypothetical protein
VLLRLAPLGPSHAFLKFFTDGISQKIKKGTISLIPFLRPPLNIDAGSLRNAHFSV